MSANDSETVDALRRAGTRAKGRRPDYFADPATDRLLSMLLALTGEVSALRERVDTLERLLDAGGSLDRGAIETYAPDRVAGEERGAITAELIARVMRAVQQDLEAMQADDPPIQHWVDELGKRSD
jgi:hypothetical protein